MADERFTVSTERRGAGGQMVGLPPYTMVVEDTWTGHVVRLSMGCHRPSQYKARAAAIAVLELLAEDLGQA